MANVVMVKSARKNREKDQEHPKLVLDFLMKLRADHKAPGLHIEPMRHAADPRARTGRVSQSLRAVLVRLEGAQGDPTYCYLGTYEHDEAIDIARKVQLMINPITGVAELRFGVPVMPESLEAAMAAADAARAQAESELRVASADASSSAAPSSAAVTPAEASSVQDDASDDSYLAGAGYEPELLTETFGLPEDIVELAFACRTADELLDLAVIAEVPYHAEVLLSLAAGEAVEDIVQSLELEPLTDDAHPAEPAKAGDQALLEAMQQPAARMQFAFVDGEDDEELRRIVEGGDIAAWRVFLHPEQQSLVERTFHGPGRVSGGAGTGKTVVLLHRARRLARENPDARTLLTTFTRTLADNLQRDLDRLDPDVARATIPGEPGIGVFGVDQLAAAVRAQAGPSAFDDAALQVLGSPIGSARPAAGQADETAWREAIDDHIDALGPDLASVSFFIAEYEQVVLPQFIVTRDDYRKATRAGRRVPLDRRRRDAVWLVVESYRRASRMFDRVTYGEIAAVAARWLQSSDTTLADHVLVDEGQDLRPAQWLLLRALVAPGDDDLFIAEDSHQRIYGQHITLSRLGIGIVGRSRRLKLNYRTTAQNLRYALAVLTGGSYLDSSDDPDSIAGYRSAFTGPEPASLPSETMEEQFDGVAALIQEWIETDRVQPESVAVLVRTTKTAEDVVRQLQTRGLDVDLGSRTGKHSRPQVLTMHASKGLEFSRVVLFDVSATAVPNSWWIDREATSDREDALLRERSLLYVAASRARDQLAVSWVEAPSQLLDDALATPRHQPTLEEPDAQQWALDESAWPLEGSPTGRPATAAAGGNRQQRDAEILALWTDELLTLDEIGARVGLTRERIRQLLKQLGAPPASEMRAKRQQRALEIDAAAVAAAQAAISDDVARYSEQGLSKRATIERLVVRHQELPEEIIERVLRRLPVAFVPGGVRALFPENALSAAVWYAIGVDHRVRPIDDIAVARAALGADVVGFLEEQDGLPVDEIAATVAAARDLADADPSVTIASARYDAVRAHILDRWGLSTAKGRSPWPPTKQTIIRRLGDGSWKDALEAMGLEIRRAGRPKGLLHFTADEYIEAVVAYAESSLERGGRPSYAGYEQWVRREAAGGVRRPSGAAIRDRFGGWASALMMARRGRGRHRSSVL
ncbi:hypothetical protein L332_01825 [Agrococcus pavilionensis RW1]|uniref:DNA 3'-5' helicase n=1 Tax=Agrococcus pavilionensis RW1 TaxID=1330458 RepID=U1LLK8_9MICO|nr:3'-5' exonuclease [Agrococcus pavilionensis]ERG63194.1 hypothetical protein L332_01825 [Agrococcus pavilionensis RW1]